MVRKLIESAVNSPLIVLLFAGALIAGGGYAFFHVNVEAYPDPAPAVVTPQISPMPPTGELTRYTLDSPRVAGRELYALHDLKALEDWTLERTFRRVPRIADVTSFGGTVKRYEIRPDPDRLKRYGITLQQLQNAIANSNANVGAGVLEQRNNPNAINVRSLGLIGNGTDPAQEVVALRD